VTRRSLSIDTGIAVLVLGASLGMLAMHGFGTPDPDARDLDGLGVLLTALSALPLAARSAASLTVYLVTGAASVALVGLAYPLDVPIGSLFAVYALAVTYSADPRANRRRVALVAVNLLVPAFAVAYAARGGPVGELVPPLLAWALVFNGVWLAGDRNRLRRQQIAELEQRAERTEREAERERRLAAAEERTRIARELHDSAGHAINVILVQAGAARLLHERDPDGSRRAIATIEDVARDTIGEIDRLVRALRHDDAGEPPVPADPTALDEILQQHRANGLTIASEIRGPRLALPRSVAWAAYRILQEALTNAARYGPGTADVAVRYRPQAVEITVSNPTTLRQPPYGGGHGIVGMQERVALLGGTFHAAVEQGVFRVHARLPHSEAAL
jgi:signal transduction histidine kinase